MQRYFETLADARGNVQAGLSVLVKIGGQNATIYSDNGTTVQSNPITSDSSGGISFYAANGTYDLSLVAASGAVTSLRSQIILFDPLDCEDGTPTSSSTVLGETGGVVKRFAVDDLLPFVNVDWDGAVGDGTTDDGAAVRTAAARVADGGTLKFTPGKTYLLEKAVADPYFGTTEHAVLFSSKTGIKVDASGAILKQTVTSAGATNGGIIAFDTCTNCEFVGSGQGYSQDVTSSTNSSAALVAVIGASSDVRVFGSMSGGRALATVRSELYPSEGVTPGNAPTSVRVVGYATNTVRGVLCYGATEGVDIDLEVDTVSRALYLAGGKNITFKLTGVDCITSGVYLAGMSVGLNTVDGTLGLSKCNGAIVFDPENTSGATATAACTVQNIKIRGVATNEARTGVAMVGVTGMTYTGSKLKSVDLSGLTLYNHGGSAGVYRHTVAAASGTAISGFHFPKIHQYNNVTKANLIDIDNTSNATLTDFVFNDMRSEYQGASYQFVKIAGGTGVVGVNLAGVKCIKDSANSGNDVDIQAGTGIKLWNFDGTISLSGTAASGSMTTVLPITDNAYDLGSASFRVRGAYAAKVYVGDGTVFYTSGSGSPEGAVTAPIGSIYSRTDGGAGTSVYIKESGTGNTGWVGK